MSIATEETGVKLRTVEVSVTYMEFMPSFDDVFEALGKRGIDIRPMWLHIDNVAGVVHARQEPWGG